MERPLVHGAVALLIGLWLLQAIWKPRRKLPPGPRPWPVVGNLFSLDRAHIFFSLQKLHQRYGPMMTLRIGGTRMILLGDRRVAADLLNRRANIYSSRPIIPFYERYVSGGRHWGTSPSNSHWKTARRLATRKLLEVKHGSSERVQELEVCLAVLEFHKHPEEWMQQMERLSTSIISSLCFGRPLWDIRSPVYVGIRKITYDIIDALTPGNHVIDAFPFFDYLPELFAPWRKYGRAVQANEAYFHVERLREVERQGKSAPACWAKDWLSQPKADRLGSPEINLAYVLSDLFIAGSDTSAVGGQSFVLACLTYPDFKKRAQADIDAIVGGERMPTFEDRQHLPFIEAIVRETLRWRPPAPGSLPHLALKDDLYEAPDGNTYFIPEGTVVVASILAITQDPELYPEPERFSPARHLDENGKLRLHTDAPVFGHGLRACPGRPLAERTLFILVATILWAFDIEPLVDEDGKPTAYDEHNYVDKAVLRALPFQCRFLMRPGKAEVCSRELERRKAHLGDPLSKK